jgi:molecular chaperone DnaJ
VATTRDYYDVLGVRRGASQDDIKRAFRQLAMQNHPDRNPGDNAAEARFKEINEAYAVLSDPGKREQYDTFGRVPGAGGFGDAFGGGGFGDIFDMFFGAQMGTRRGAGPRRGADLRYDLELALEDAVYGLEKDIDVTRQDTCPACKGSGAAAGTSPVRCRECGGQGQVRRVSQSFLGQIVNVVTCPACRGSGEQIDSPCSSCGGGGRVRQSKQLRVKVPAGVDDGDQIRLGNEGEAGIHGGSHGDLYVAIHVRAHPMLRRNGRDLYFDLGINFAQAALGDSIEVPTIDGPEKVEIPPGTQYGTRLRLQGRGVPHIRTGRRGDQIVVTHIVTPTKLTGEQRKALETLGGRTGQPTEAPKNLLDRLRDSLGL